MHPILFQFGPLAVHSYGFFVAAGFLTAGFLAARRCHEYGINQERLLDLLMIILVSGLAGARILHILLNLDYFMQRPLEILFIHKGGLAIHGGIIAGVAAGTIFVRRKGLPLGKTYDLIIQYLPLAESIGRIGCLLNGCCYGRVTRYMGVIFPGDTLPRHPTQIYMSLGLIVIFVILRAFSQRAHREGDIFFLYFIFYGALRFLLDFLRDDMPAAFLSLNASQIISAALIMISIFAMLFPRKRGLKKQV